MGLPALYYNSLTIALPIPRLFRCQPRNPANVNQSTTGHIETIAAPRMDIPVRVEWPVSKDTTLITKIENWFQWAQLGNAWAYAQDSTKIVNTTLSTGASAGASSVVVTSATGITPGQVYKLINGPYYQLVLISGVSGTTISIATTPLNFPFLSGSIFRDWLYFPGQFVRPPDYPIILSAAGIDTWPAVMPFEFVLDFMEKVS